ncbi:CHASE2 domain-containing protein, partial [bacterium]
MAKAKEDKLQTAKTYIGRAAASKFPMVFCIVFAFVVVSGDLMQAFDWLDCRHSDILFRRRGMVEADSKIKILEIDDASIDYVGQYPWPRSVYKKLLDKLFKEGISVIALDVLFIDPSRPEEDRELIDVTRRHADQIVHAVATDNKILNQMEFIYPFPGLRKVAKNIGQVAQPIKDNDGSFRYEPLVIGMAPRMRSYEWGKDPQAMPTLGLAALALHEKKDFRSYLALPGLSNESTTARLNFSGEQEKIMGVETLPDGSTEDIVSRRYGIERIPAWRVLKGELDPAQRARLKGAIVFLGSTSQGAFDHFPSPFTGIEPGVIVHATLADNLMRNRHITEGSPLLPVLLIPLTILAAYLLVRLSPLWSGLSFVAILFGMLGVHEALFLRLYWVPIAGPLLAFFGAFLVLIVHRTVEENRKAAEVRGMFGQYVPPEVVDILVKNPERLKLGGDKRDMTIFFLDIAHFTTISEKMTPEA